MMRQFGLEVTAREDWREFYVAPSQRPKPTDVVLPPDLGSAVFGLAACTLNPSKVTFRSSTPIAGHPEAVGARLADGRGRAVPLRARRSLDLDGPRRHAARRAARSTAATSRTWSRSCRCSPAARSGKSALGHVAHVRLKESDRVASMLQLRKMGARVEFDGNDMTFEGVERLHGATLSSFNDHRVLMALTVAGSIATGVTELSYPHAYRISYPEFLDHMNALGIPAAVTGSPARVPALGQARMILDDLDRHARERPGERAVVEVSADGTVRELSWGALKIRVRRGRVSVAPAWRAGGRARGVPASEPPRVRDDRARHAARGRGVRAADADLPRARAGVHAPRERRARAVRARRVPRPRLRRDGHGAARRSCRRSSTWSCWTATPLAGDGRGRSSQPAAGRRSPSCCSPRAPRASPRARCTATTC